MDLNGTWIDEDTIWAAFVVVLAFLKKATQTTATPQGVTALASDIVAATTPPDAASATAADEIVSVDRGVKLAGKGASIS